MYKSFPEDNYIITSDLATVVSIINIFDFSNLNDFKILNKRNVDNCKQNNL